MRRPEPTQHTAIHRLLTEAFGNPDEALLVEKLRQDGSVALELIAEDNGEVVGYAALSWLTSPPGALALAPVAVAPARQREGIGSKLVCEVLARAANLDSDLVFVLGDPAYYERFGFSVEAAAGFDCSYAGPHFMALRLDARAVRSGRVVYPKAFDCL